MNTPIHYHMKALCDEQLRIKIVERQLSWQSAFSVLIERYHTYLYHRCLSRLPNRSDVDDVLQDVYLSAYRFLGQFQGRSSLKTWLTRIADNECNANMRKKQRSANQEYLMTEHIEELIAVNETSANSRLHDRFDQHRVIVWIMTHLAPKSREILALRYWAELSLEEIAITLDIGLSAVKMRLHRALEQCSVIINDDIHKIACSHPLIS